MSVNADLGCSREVEEVDLLALKRDLGYEGILIHLKELELKLDLTQAKGGTNDESVIDLVD